MTETTAVTCCVPGSIGVEPASIAFSAAANGCGDEPPPSTIAVMRPSERFDADGERLRAGAGVCDRGLEGVAVELGLVAARERRAVDLVRARVDGGIDQGAGLGESLIVAETVFVATNPCTSFVSS